MRTALLALAAAASLTSAVAMADATPPKPGAMIVSSDGKRIGRIDRILTDKAGAQTASVIYDSRFIYVPVSTLTVGADGRATTTLSRKEVSALR